MNRISKLFIAAVLLFAGATGCTTIEPGHAGIQVNMWGTDKGVQSYPVVTGRVSYNPITTRIFEYPTFVQTGVWTQSKDEGSPANEEICFNSKEGLVICGDYSLSFQITQTQVPSFYVKFRSDNMKDWLHGFLRNIARDALNEIAATYGVEELYGVKKEEFIGKVRDRINAQISEYGHLEQFGFIGAPRLPEQVTAALNAKIKATQDALRVENELRQQQAEAQKVIAKAEGDAQSIRVMADAQAEANKKLSASITENLVEWKRLDVVREKWDGSVPAVLTSGNTGSSPVILPLDVLKKK